MGSNKKIKCQCCLDTLVTGNRVFLLDTSGVHSRTNWMCETCAEYFSALNYPICIPDDLGCSAVVLTTIASTNEHGHLTISVRFKFCNRYPCVYHQNVTGLPMEVIEQAARPGGPVSSKANASFEEKTI